VSDKGIPAALFMAMTLTAFVVFAKDQGRSLPEGIRLLNGYLCDNNQSQMFVTLCAGIGNLRTGLLEYCDADYSFEAIMSRKRIPKGSHTAKPFSTKDLRRALIRSATLTNSLRAGKSGKCASVPAPQTNVDMVPDRI